MKKVTPLQPKKSANKALALRKKLQMNQTQFWSRIGVTQSGASRYESGRLLSRPVSLLLELAYGNDPVRVLAKLRNVPIDSIWSMC